VIDALRREMQQAAKALEYERAAELRDRIRLLEAERLGST
jgi:protein-arginine kinase activator protein McsA